MKRRSNRSGEAPAAVPTRRVPESVPGGGRIGLLDSQAHLERRLTHRVPLAVGVHLSRPGAQELAGTTLDCSIGGVGVQTSEPLLEGQVWRLTADLDDGPLVAFGEVRYCRPTGTHYRVGFEFTHLVAAGERRIARLVAIQDRRMSVRVAITISLEYRRDLPGEVFHGTFSNDVSLGGIHFKLVSPCEEGDRVQMLLTFGFERIAVEGTVVQILSAKDGKYAAVCFDRPTTFRHRDLESAIRRFMDEFPRHGN